MIKGLISVIVPVYNVEKFLPDFLKSIESQTYKKIEIIFVNDCSSDNSKKIIEQFCKKHSNAKIINHNKNEGVSSARNSGVCRVSGEFFTFVDPDDMVNPNLFEYYFNALSRSNADFASCRYEKVTEQTHFDDLKVKHSVKFKYKYLKMNKTFLKFVNVYSGPYNHLIWNKCFRTKIYESLPTYPDIANTKISIGDDIYVFYNYLSCCKNGAIVTNKIYCYYRQRNKSICHSKFGKKNMKLLSGYDPIIKSKLLLDNKYKKHLNALLSIRAYSTFLALKYNKWNCIKDIQYVFKMFSKNVKYCWCWKCNVFFYRFTPLIYPFIFLIYKKYLKKIRK